MSEHSNCVQVEFRILDDNGVFGDVNLYQDDDEAIIEQDATIHRISAQQLKDLRKCIDQLAEQMSRLEDYELGEGESDD
jgi:hypothetical protein